MKIELILSDEQVRLMRDVLDNKSAEIQITTKNYLTVYAEAKNKEFKAAALDDLERAYRQATMLGMIAFVIREQYDSNKRKL